MEASFPDLVRQEFAALIRDYGFQLVAEDKSSVRLESTTVSVVAQCSPLREFEVLVSPLGTTDRYATWTYAGMVGTASVARLLQIAAERMTADPAILGGDAAFYESLADETRRLSKAWTAYYSGTGPRPITGKLPP